MSGDDLRRKVSQAQENRLLPRYPFGLVQQIAEIVDGEMPSPEAFESVRCVDISRGGFAFYRKALPNSSELVVALGEAPNFVYLSAIIVESAHEDRFGHTFFRCGCKFTGRVELKEHSLALKRQQDLEAAFFLMSGQGDHDGSPGPPP